MDVAYDHIQEESLSPEQIAATYKQNSSTTTFGDDSSPEQQQSSPQPPKQTLNAEFQEAYNSLLTTTPWGAKLGGFFSDVKKQSSTFYDEARQEAAAAGGEAFKGFADLRESLVSRARSLSTGQDKGQQASGDEVEGANVSTEKAREDREGEDNEGMISKFKAEAAKRLKELEKAEEAADAAIFRFGANIGNFLKDAVSIAPPSDSEKNKDGSAKVLFESKGEDGKRVIHGTRFEAQLHAIHTSRDKFLKDPEGEEWEKWKTGWDFEAEKGAIEKDEERFEELKRMRKRLVPGEVAEEIFWKRYYFLRMIVESEEKRRKEVLKGQLLPLPSICFPTIYLSVSSCKISLTICLDPIGAAQSTETVSWDDDSDEDDEQAPTPQQNEQEPSKPSAPGNASPASLTTIHPTSDISASGASLKPAESRRSQDEKSQADSDASYDLVSGATSQAPGSPKDAKKADEEEEEDWE